MFQGGFGSSQAGGGFGDAGGFNTTGASPGANKAQNNRPESLSPVTNCMVRRAVHNADKDMFVFKENIDLHLVEMVGYIMDITEGSTCYEYHICDRTAPEPLYIRKFLNDNDDASALPRSNCYVRVVGHLRFVKEQPSIMAFSIKEIKSHNEFLLHRLSVVRFMCGKELTPKLGSKLAASGGVSSAGSFNNNNGGAAQGDGSSMPGMTMTQTKVYNALKKCSPDNQTGLSVRDIQSTTSMPMNDIRVAIEFLSNEGHIYSTIDDEHFKLTDHC